MGHIQGMKEAPTEVAVLVKFNVCQDKALAILGLSIDPTLLYVQDGIDNPEEVREKLRNQYCKKTWLTGESKWVRPWPHQYFNKKGACLLIFLLLTGSHGRCQNDFCWY